MYEIQRIKNNIRTKYAAIRNGIEADEKTANDGKICACLASLVSYRYSDTVLFYYPIRSEVNLLPLIESALSQGKRVAFPKCDRSKNTIGFYLIDSLDCLVKGAYGIPEPREGCTLFDTDDSRPSALLIPALVYDRKGYRLGYGKGYYDRFVPGYSGTKIGICYSGCVTDTLPKGRYDLPVDFIVTEKGVLIVDKN